MSELAHNTTPEQALRQELERQGLFCWVNQGARDDRGSVEIVYEAIVLDDAGVAEAVAKANSYEDRSRPAETAADLNWDDVKDRPEAFEGEDRLGALKGAVDKFFSS